MSRFLFTMAFWFHVKKRWADYSPRDASRELFDYIGAPFGHPDYDWSWASARSLAKAYVDEFGEETP
ncbi:hypothetical protein FB480_101906 [Agrobacterium vitis]|nr:hypothetical protein FB480_101906 [Agrobacterium vitis]